MTIAKFPHISAPGQIGPVALANRTVTAPMTRVSADPGGVPNDLMRDHYLTFVAGGFGLVISEGTYIDKLYSQGYRDQPGIVTAAQIAGWRTVTDAVHGAGGKIFLQLMHAGAASQYNDHQDGTIGPSAVAPVGKMASNYYGEGPYRVPRAVQPAEMAAIVDAYATAAQNAVTAGFDGVEIHGANGYLPDQFLSVHSNIRDDEYGGPVENRIRFHGELVAAVKSALGDDVPVGIRISQIKVNDFTYVWPGGADDAGVIFAAMAAAGADYLHVNAPPAPVEVFDSGRTLAGLARTHFARTIMACGGLNDPATAEALIAAGDADFIALARGALADPAWPRKIVAGEKPVPFDPGMVQPSATLQNTIAWRKRQAG